MAKTDQTMFEIVKYVQHQLDKGPNVDIIYLHFSEAFGKVLHKRFVQKLKNVWNIKIEII